MKRILSLLICLTLIASSVSFVTLASDSQHWAYETVKSLVDEGIVSGDSFGNLNLDKSITRAEFIKTLNKYFGFTKRADSNFSDVGADKWYYDELLIAKGEGYIKGDASGNANPDSPITRAEVAVTVARILKLADGVLPAFSDADLIPEWARGAIGALCEKGVIKGYEDGSFRASNQVTRGEAFVIVKRNEKPASEDAKPEENISGEGINTNVYIPPASTGSSGGGGGGGGGGSAPVQNLKATVSPRYFDEKTFSLEFVATNASAYTVKIIADGNTKEEALTLSSEKGTYKYADLTSLITGLISTYGNGLDCDIYIRAIGRPGYASTDFVKVGSVFAELDIPEIEGVTIAYNPSTDNYDLSWTVNPELNGYKVSLFTDAELTTLETSYETTDGTYTIDMSSFDNLDKFYVAVTAIKDGVYANVKKSEGIITKGFGGGEGTDENPYLIYSNTQFANIGAYPAASFKQMADITDQVPVTQPATPLDVEFKGSYDGNGKKLYVTLSTDVATTDSATGFGLFPLINSATVKNINLYGTVAGRGNVGGIVGRGTGKCTIENINNYATVSSSTGFCGGIAGRIYDGDTTGTTIKNCINHAYVKSFGYVGGIIGVTNDKNSVIYCGNYGEIDSTLPADRGNGYAGGIVGNTYGNVSLSYNFGKIVSHKYAGGIAGNMAKPDFIISDCFNAGEIDGEEQSAAIICSQGANNPIIKNSYNVNKALKLFEGEATATYTNCYNLNSSDTAAGITVKTAAQLSELEINDNFTIYSENEENTDYNSGYRYPQLSGALVLKDFVYNDNNFKMSIVALEYDKNEDKWYVTINPSIKNVTKYVLSLTGATDTVITAFNSDNKYEIEDIPEGSVTVSLKGYGEGGSLLETAEDLVCDFTFSGGTGTADSPYIITNAVQFKKAFSSADYISKSFLLTGFDEEALVLTDYKPFNQAFKGTLIGGNMENGSIVEVMQKIDITLNLSNTDHIDRYQGAIFHKLDGATVKNIALYGTLNSNQDITNTSYTGGLVGHLGNSSTLENIENRMIINSVQDYAVAGLVGSAGGGTNVIKNCRNYGSVTGKKNAAGIIGDKFRTTMLNCYNYGEIKGTTQVGGLIGENKDNTADTVKLCGNFGDVTATAGMAGGIAGVARKNIEQSFNAGVITASTYAGGIVGETYSGKTVNITNCFNIGSVDGTTAEGLVIGNHKATSTVSYFYDLVNPDVSSVCGAKTGSITVNNTYGFSMTESVKTNDVEKTSKANIKTKFTNDSIWTTSEGYNYPDLKGNSVVTNKPDSFILPE
ncbi:MAG: S-layer homology domain-containing protein [Ruminococcaceae bacterium]|nr:S-layer homology domain-containing protein [Oscillospiraceae bacterium]